ncbi:hypothetical protein [Kribbella speibonae]|uniref:Uncharacterized protein n=1 Tax=Kribbella speibonae TaxID=1572660 RepID=A0A4R0IEL8_9ACTN|nr:hypothetical protein [Kribbella speibonae]TCC28084.1 hypothetical protein E0H58_09215 [Kribbella speibonae]TCC29646.1 hypothetical protein E0H92_42280 [Kribbella speibonae]
MTEVDLPAVYRAAEKLLQTGTDGGTALTQALSAITREGIDAACGGDETGRAIFEGFSARVAGLNDAGAALRESLTNISDGVAAAANLVQGVDGHNAEVIRAADLGLQANGKPLPAPDASTPGR